MRVPGCAVVLGACLAVTQVTPSAGQDNPGCVAPYPRTEFCGRPLGWILMDPQPFPGMTTFLNEEFTFGVSHQSAHGKTITNVLYDDTIRSLTREMDRRLEMPEGTHVVAYDEEVEKAGIRGRRIAILSGHGEVPVSFMMDIYYSARFGWVAQTAHVGAIELERLIRAHHLAVEELKIDP